MNRSIENVLHPYGTSPHYRNARQEQVDEHRQNCAVKAIIHNFKRGQITLDAAVDQLRAQDRFEEEINTVLSRALADRLLPKCITGCSSRFHC